MTKKAKRATKQILEKTAITEQEASDLRRDRAGAFALGAGNMYNWQPVGKGLLKGEGFDALNRMKPRHALGGLASVALGGYLLNPKNKEIEKLQKKKLKDQMTVKKASKADKFLKAFRKAKGEGRSVKDTQAWAKEYMRKQRRGEKIDPERFAYNFPEALEKKLYDH